MSRKGPESPVYDIKAESGRGKIRALHRNLLLPCDYLPPEHGVRINQPVKTEKSETSKRKEKQPETKGQSFASPEQTETDSDSEAEERPPVLPNDLKQHTEKFKGSKRKSDIKREKQTKR